MSGRSLPSWRINRQGTVGNPIESLPALFIVNSNGPKAHAPQVVGKHVFSDRVLPISAAAALPSLKFLYRLVGTV